MNLIVFDVKGTFAHFRKYYTNSSSLTYKAPPRTTVAGIIAAILGYDRDTYYEKLSSDNASIGVRILEPSRKIIQTLNFVKATSQRSLILFNEDHTQIPFEVLCNYSGIKFRIYFSHKDEAIMEELRQRLEERRYYYAPYLGIASFNCSICNVQYSSADLKKESGQVLISSLINTKNIIEKSISLTPNLNLAKENMPRDFNEGRYLKESSSYLYDEKGSSIGIKTDEKIAHIVYRDGTEENIMFM